jgi:hypothetical protein
VDVDSNGSRLVLIAGVFLVASMILIGLPTGDMGPLRYFAGGIMVGVDSLLLIFWLREGSP